MSKPGHKVRDRKKIKSLKNMPDAKIATDDIPEVLDWDEAVRSRFYRPVKQAMSLRLDADVLVWFKTRNEKYQSKINEVLREYMRRNR